jgi:uncharacterized protein
MLSNNKNKKSLSYSHQTKGGQRTRTVLGTTTADSNNITDGRTTFKPLTATTGTAIIERKVKLNSPILIAGFPGPGLIGSISTSYIINKLHMSQIACVESEFIVPGVIYVGGKLRHPFRLYANKEGNVCVIVCEAPIMIEGMYSVLETVIKWAINNKVKEVIGLEGIPVEGPVPDAKRIPMILASNGEAADSADLIRNDNEINRIRDKKEEPGDMTAAAKTEDDNDAHDSYPNTAFIGGITGGLLSSCLSNGIACKALLLPTTTGIPDPEGAAIIIESISKNADNEMLKTIDTRHLREKGANIKRRMEEILRSVREQQQLQQLQQQGQGQTGAKERIMYG